MDFKNKAGARVLAALISVVLVGSVGCSVSPGVDTASDYNVGNPLSTINGLSTPDGQDTQTVVLFDKLLRRIHQFDVGAMKPVRSLAVRNPSEEHYVVHGLGGNYIIDLSMKGLSIFNKYNQANHNPIRFQGKPRGAAFNRDRGVFVMYDDMSSVGILKLDANGEVTGHTVRGARVIPTSSAVISAGDIDSAGNLILAMNDGSLVVADTMATIAAANSWVATAPVSTGLSDIKWLAPIASASPQQLILVRSSTKVSVVNVVTGAEVSSFTIDGQVEKMSKFVDPHVLIRKDSKVTVVYARAGVIETKTFILGAGQDNVLSILNSTLNLAKDTWSYVDTPVRLTNVYNDLDETHQNRWFRRYTLSDTLSTHNIAIDNDPQIEISENFIFALFKDELGYAEKINLNTEDKQTIERFNLRYIPAN